LGISNFSPDYFEPLLDRHEEGKADAFPFVPFPLPLAFQVFFGNWQQQTGKIFNCLHKVVVEHVYSLKYPSTFKMPWHA